MTLRIESIPDKIRLFFIDKWWENYHFHNPDYEKIEDERTRFGNDLLQLQTQIFDILNESVFLGEYVKSDSISEIFSEINESLKPIDYFPPNEILQEFIQQRLNNDFLDCIKCAINLYSHEAFKIQKHYSFNKKDYSVDRKPFVKAFEDTTIISRSALELLLFFDSNLSLASLEHYLTSDPEDFDLLLEFLHPATLEKFGANRFTNLFRERCKFLICKWITRKQHINKEQVYYLADSKEKKGDLSEFSTPLFDHWKEYILAHYQISTSWESEITSSFDEIKHISYENLNLLQLHRLIKYFKDINKNLDNLHEVVEEFRRRFEDIKKKGDSKYDYHTHSLALSYAMNNEFSLYLEDDNHTLEEVEEFYKKIDQFQSSSGNYNFFPQFKYFGFLVNKLEKIYEERKPTLDFIEPAKNLIKKCRQVFEKYVSNANWSEKHYNYVFQLPYKDCLIPSGSNVISQIYLPSSFLLPLPKDKDKEEFDKNAYRLTYLEASIDVFTNLKVDMEHLKKVSNDVENMKADIHSREIKSMEILGIFTAVVTFILGSLPTFKFIHTATQAFLFMYALATSLALFVLVFFSVNRGKDALIKNIKLITIVAIAVATCWIYLIYQVKDPSIIEINRTEKEIEKPEIDTALINRLTNALNSPLNQHNSKVDSTANRERIKNLPK